MKKSIKLSVILPVYNGEKYIRQAVNSIRNNTFKDYELIIVDDGSTDSTPELISKLNPDMHLTNIKNFGHPYTRNRAANTAKGEILYFTDADVELYSDTLEKVYRHFKVNKSDCVIGVYSLPDRTSNLCTIYKNSWIRFSYLNSDDNVNWFFTAVGAIKKDIWEKNRNFQNYALQTGGSDITFGFGLSEKGTAILMDKNLQVKHLREYSLYFLLKNDFHRSYGYSSIAFQSKKILTKIPQKGFANISRSFINGCVLSSLILLLGLLSFYESRLLFIMMFLLIFYGANNLKFYRFVKKHYNLSTTVKCAAIMFIDHLTCFCGVICAFIKVHIFNRIKRWRKNR